MAPRPERSGERSAAALLRGGAPRPGPRPTALHPARGLELRKALAGIVSPRVIDVLERVPRGLPLRLTLVVAAPARRDDLDRTLFSHPLWRVEERAPQVFDLEIPNTDFEGLLERWPLFRKVDLGGRVFGVRVPAAEDRAVVRIALEEPLTPDQRRELMRIGLRITREGQFEVSGEAPGRALHAFVMIDWLGPVEVRRVALGEKA